MENTLKFRYSIRLTDGSVKQYVVTLDEVEKAGINHVLMTEHYNAVHQLIFDFNIIARDRFTGMLDQRNKEIYENDELLYTGTNMSSMTVEFKDGCFVGVGPFNTHPIKTYFEAQDFKDLEIINTHLTTQQE